MHIEDKNKFLTWALVVLTLLNLCTIGTIIYHIITEKNEMSKSSERYASPLNGRDFMETLDFTHEQKEQFHLMNNSFRASVREINEELDLQKNSLFAELRKENTDTVACNRISDEIGVLHKELKVKTYRFYLDVKKICRADQQGKLNDVFAPIFNFDGRLESRHGRKSRHAGRHH
jgi:Spy/CpxP family protein refolding chaperone